MRKHYLDNIRWITVVIVVFYHVIMMYSGIGMQIGLGKITALKSQPWDIFMYLVYPWLMPILYIVAGISSRLYFDGHTDREFVKTRTRKLLVPSTIGLFAFQFIQGYISMSLGNAFDGLTKAGVPGVIQYLIMVASGSGVLWFLHLLWLYSMILVFVKRIEKGHLLALCSKMPLWGIMLLVFPVWGAGQILNTPIILVYRVAFYFVFFMFGYYVFSNDEVMEKMKKASVPFIILGLTVTICFAVLYFLVYGGREYADKPVNRGPLYMLSAYFGSLAILSGMACFGDFHNHFTEWMSKRSFGLYVFHYLGISSVALYVAKPGLLPAASCYALSLLAGFVFGYGLNWIISKIPFFRWAVLGVKKEK